MVNECLTKTNIQRIIVDKRTNKQAHTQTNGDMTNTTD